MSRWTLLDSYSKQLPENNTLNTKEIEQWTNELENNSHLVQNQFDSIFKGPGC